MRPRSHSWRVREPEWDSDLPIPSIIIFLHTTTFPFSALLCGRASHLPELFVLGSRSLAVNVTVSWSLSDFFNNNTGELTNPQSKPPPLKPPIRDQATDLVPVCLLLSLEAASPGPDLVIGRRRCQVPGELVCPCSPWVPPSILDIRAQQAQSRGPGGQQGRFWSSGESQITAKSSQFHPIFGLCLPIFYLLSVQYSLLKFFIYFQWKDNCFTMLCWFLPQVYIHMSPPSWPSVPPPTPSHPSTLSQSTVLSCLHPTANSCWLSLLHVVCICVNATLSFVSPSPSPPQVQGLFSMSVSLFLPPK